MVFFKLYLLTLTCIVIAVWVMPVSATLDVNSLRNDCEAILISCGFTNEINDSTHTEITGMKYSATINALTKEENTGTNLHRQMENFVKNTGIYTPETSESDIEIAAKKNGFRGKNGPQVN
ncbi:uncharacterized protein LOC100302403 precursor [Acyrthosiphon pisum]|uniref:Uncharacterized protein n=1 Tax=Acyrthosiphon pisum TaxID=7029 RepID=C4WXK1_ACYPI|nr:uncharacterized protein LOC100302403 precursor [Acyrthosiphon pisum]BAH72621.1 hypothetical protein [Acyrthosiphon pisum]|eukprot:NP_001156509.1 uncharacterized protein LOC100302403 precursor [Acyrthosiphon pisum]